MPSPAPESLTPTERRAAASLAAVYTVRMLGLFLILPVFSVYAIELEGATPFLVGIAIGIYGLTQGLLQIPLGMLSDRIGRKPVIVGGLLLFVFGSLVAAASDSLAGIIAGRALQGMGAIAAAVLALAADLTREEVRARIMAAIGASIALSFAAALVLGPVLNRMIGVPGIFSVTAVLGVLAILVVLFAMPQPAATLHRDVGVVPTLLTDMLRDRELLRLNFGIFTLHFALAANFVVLPVLFSHELAFEAAAHWKLYLPVIVGSFAVAIPLIVLGEKRRKVRELLVGGVALLCLTQILYLGAQHVLLYTAAVVLLFFIASNILEAVLPSLVAKLAPPERKGTAMGVYSTAQFLGIFAGGAMGGWIWQSFGISGIFVLTGALVVLWLLAAATMRPPRYLSAYLLHVGSLTEAEAAALGASLVMVPGVAEARVIAADGVAYLRVDRRDLDEVALREFSAARP